MVMITDGSSLRNGQMQMSDPKNKDVTVYQMPTSTASTWHTLKDRDLFSSETDLSSFTISAGTSRRIFESIENGSTQRIQRTD